ncbi:MAG TPA: diacylglycerol kinase family protein [Anaerolineae bacterium]|nr:diacylglycerol kinase family protein [Anaerolineae bacterium]
MNFKRVHVIANPASGKDQPILKTLNNVFHPVGIDWDIYVTKAGGDARRLAAEAVQAGADAVAVYGGDGTVAEVAAGLFNSQMPLVILPGGTTNATARSMGIPIELAEAAKVIADPDAHVRVMDMLQVGDSYFFGVVAMGIPGEVAVMADREAKDRLGNLAYALSAIRATVRAPNSDYAITLDGQEFHSHGVICIILNQSAGLMHVKPPVDGADGLLDVAVFRDENVATVSKAAANVILRNENVVPVEHWQGREVTVVSQPAQAVQADGEVLPAGSVTVRVLHAAVRFVVPGTKAQ